MRPSIRAIALAALLLPAYRAYAFDVTITSGPGSGGAWVGNSWTPNADGATLSASEIATHLASGPVTVVSTDGDALIVRAGLGWSAHTLTLSAGGDLDIESSLGASGTGGLVLEYGQGSVAAGNTARYRVAAPVNLAATASFSTQQGSDGPVVSYTVLTSLGAQGSTTGTDLQGMQGNLAANYALGADIDASTASAWSGGFAPVGNATSKFTGRFDGLGHSIANLGIQRGGTDNVGLFGYANAARFANVGLTNADILGTASVGALLGRGDGNSSVVNAWSSGTVKSDSTATQKNGVGGLVGNLIGTVADSHSTATVDGYFAVGGLVGTMATSSGAFGEQISNSWASGDVHATYGYAGGLVGASWARITNSYATGNVSGGEAMTNSAQVLQTDLGGLVGYAHSSAYWIAQEINPTQYQNVHATGNVTGSDVATTGKGYGFGFGGLIGATDGVFVVHNAFATGNVSGYSAVGGLIGRTSNSGSGSNSIGSTLALYSVYTRGGTVTGHNFVGGLIGENFRSIIIYSYVASGAITGDYDSSSNLYQVGAVIGGTDCTCNGSSFDSSTGVLWDYETTGLTNPTGKIQSTGAYLTPVVRWGASSGPDYYVGNNIFWGGNTAQMMTLDPYQNAGWYTGQGGTYTILTPATAAGQVYSDNNRIANQYFIYEGKTYPLLMAFLTPVTVSADLSAANRAYNGQVASGTVGSYNTSVPVDPGQILGTLTYVTSSANAGIYRASDGTLDVGGSLYSGQLGYEILYSPDTSLTIAKAPLVLGTSNVTKTYDGTTSAIGTAVVVGGQLFRNDSVSGGHFAFADKNAGTDKTVTVDSVTVSDGNGGGNYAVSYVGNTHGTINKASASVVANSGSLVYNGHAQSVGGYSVSGLVNNETPAVLTGLAESGGSGTNVGSYAHTVSGTDGNYALTFTAGALTITPRAQVLTFPAQYAPVRYFTAGDTFQIGPLASSDAAPYANSPIVYSSLSGSVCSVNGTTVTMLAVGTCTIAANQAADANHTVATQVTQTVQLSGDAPPLVLWIDGSDFVRYGQHADYTVTLTTAGNAANAAVVTFALSGDVDAVNASLVCEGGGNGASCTQDGSDPLRFTVTLPASRTLTWHVSLPVRGDAAGDAVGLSVGTADAVTVSATSTLVIFRDGFEAP